jgi:hypothetical protein
MSALLAYFPHISLIHGGYKVNHGLKTNELQPYLTLQTAILRAKSSRKLQSLI